ncbi:hypothetical protein PYR77_18340 (plasmid) [Acinetobacter soli]|nr:hypothetical protein [Acinetobacter soli]WEH90911.1 hypothetical protein PYR75_00920 [Acinetobacter soli]WEH99358.1 hypothetical protein PYR76_17775 [Acinetobacter soli]WEI02262.1 hypothetical protein PYR77_18340 [Acinetobacter soli]
MANEDVAHATQNFNEIKNEFQLYKRRVQDARDTKEYPDSFSSDKARRDYLKIQHNEAFDERKNLWTLEHFYILGAMN